MQITKHSMNWLPKQSTYDYVQQQNEKRHAAHQAFLDSQDSVSSAFSTIFNNLSQGQSTAAAQAALSRVTSSKSSSGQAIQDALDQISQSQDQLSSAGVTTDGSSQDGTSDGAVDLLA